MTATSALWGFRHGGFVSFSVHNTYLHLTNVNTTKDKRITPPPVIMILDLYCCVVRKSACVCVCTFTCVTFLCRSTRVFRVCLLRERTKTPSGVRRWMCQYETLLSLSGPFLKQLGGGVGPGGEQQGVQFEAGGHAASPQLKPFSLLWLSCATFTRRDTHIHLVCVDSPPLPSPLQCQFNTV